MFEKKILVSSSDGLEISVLMCRPKGAMRGLVQIVHGMCEHKERYQPFMEFLAANGFASVIHDHRGHGESVREQGDLGYFYEGGYLGLVDDLRMVNEWARTEVAGASGAAASAGPMAAAGAEARADASATGDAASVPVVLLGHSMGSMAVRAFAKRHDDMIRALIVCGSPSYNPAAPVGKAVARVFGLFAGKKCRPKLVQKLSFGAFNKGIANPASPNSWVCSDPAVVEAYDRDPFCNFQFTADGFENLFSLMQDAYRIKDWRPRNPEMPVMFISGADDPCLIDHAKFDAAVARMKEAGYSNVSAKLYPGMRHEIMNETAKAEVWNDILGFVAAAVTE